MQSLTINLNPSRKGVSVSEEDKKIVRLFSTPRSAKKASSVESGSDRSLSPVVDFAVARAKKDREYPMAQHFINVSDVKATLEYTKTGEKGFALLLVIHHWDQKLAGAEEIGQALKNDVRALVKDNGCFKVSFKHLERSSPSELRIVYTCLGPREEKAPGFYPRDMITFLVANPTGAIKNPRIMIPRYDVPPELPPRSAG